MGLPAGLAPGAATYGFANDMAIFGQKSKVIRPAKIFCEAHNFVPRWNFDELFVAVKAWDAVDTN
jgi:hypothetical protein